MNIKEEKEIHKLLDYVAGKYPSKVHKRSDGIFTLDNGVLSDNLHETHDKDGWDFTVNFNDKTIKLHAYNESYHNGDHYGSVNVSVDWNHLLTGHGYLRSVAKRFALEEVEQKIKDDLAEKRLEEILADK